MEVFPFGWPLELAVSIALPFHEVNRLLQNPNSASPFILVAAIPFAVSINVSWQLPA